MLGTLALTACATTPISPQQGTPVPAQRLYGFQQQTPSTAHIVVTRDAGLRGSACMHTLYVDGVRAAEFDPGEVATFYVSPGSHIFGVAASSALCSDGLKEIQVVARNDRVNRLRISISSTGDVAISPTAY